MNTRIATISDLDGIIRVSAFLGYEQSTKEEAKSRLASLLGSDSDFIWVYEQNAEIKGWIHMFLSIRLASPTFAEIGGLVVDETCRRQGIGRELVGTAVAFSHEKHLSVRVRCNTQRDGANIFYGQLGFKNKKSQKVHELKNI